MYDTNLYMMCSSRQEINILISPRIILHYVNIIIQNLNKLEHTKSYQLGTYKVLTNWKKQSLTNLEHNKVLTNWKIQSLKKLEYTMF